MSIDPKKRLQDLLVELFQLDKSDLDFGIYRVMNLRAADVQKFITEILPSKLEEVSRKLAARSLDSLRGDVEGARGELQSLAKLLGKKVETESDVEEFCRNNPDAEPVKKYVRAKESAARQPVTEDLERDIYNDLFRFFDRYYEEGDFVTKPRAGDATYMIPYNGEETKFYWANYDQYYIKTGENFKNYVFTNNETDSARKVTVEFRLVEAETEVNNNQNKKGRVFIPAGADYFAWDGEARKLTLKFYYKVPSKEEKEAWGDKQSVKAENKGINERLVFTGLEGRIRETKDAFLIRLWEKNEREAKNGKRGEKLNEFYYHLNRYTTVNSFDYFIHKDLRKFLRGELDYFLKHEIFSLNFLADDLSEEQTRRGIEQNVVRASVLRDLAARIIEFLGEIEDFQKMLYEKKKFVVQSDYCLTLDMVPEGVRDEVIKFVLEDEGQRQLKEWAGLGFIGSLKVKAKDLKADGYLVLDTQFLPVELKFKLLSEIEDLDEKTGGLLINSDNWQALNFLSEKYKGEIKCVYIDPPYNTDAGPIVYKNGYRSSSWVSLMESRLLSARRFLTNEGIICVTIDDYQAHELANLLDEIFTRANLLGTAVIRNNPSGRSTVKGFSVCHEYAFFYRNTEDAELAKLPRSEKQLERFTEEEGIHVDWRNFRKDGGAVTHRAERPKQFYPIYVKPNAKTLRIPEMLWNKAIKQWEIQEQPLKDEVAVLPIDERVKNVFGVLITFQHRIRLRI